MNPGNPIGGPLSDVPPFSTDKTAVFFFEDYVEGYEVILMISKYKILEFIFRVKDEPLDAGGRNRKKPVGPESLTQMA